MHVDAHAVGVRARRVERVYPAQRAELVLCYARAERVERQLVCALQEFELSLGDNEMRVLLHEAHRTVAAVDGHLGRGCEAESNRLTVASTFSDYQILLFFHFNL